MADVRSTRAVLCAVCLVMVVYPVGIGAAASSARTPAEIEARRASVSDRLTAIDLEIAAIDARLIDPALALDERRGLTTRRGALADEQATLRKEALALARSPTRTATGPLQPGEPQGLNPLDPLAQTGQVSSGQAFNPAISVIPDVAYYTDDRRGRASDLARSADGFADGGHDDTANDTHGHGALERGFNLREMELALSGSVDPYFDVWATLAVSPDAIDAEEVYIQTRRLLPGLQLRVGRFFSGVGYLNKQHPHQWDFVDQALAYDAILGGHLGDVGLQLTWLPSLPVYTLLGVEALQGEGERLSNQEHEHFPGFFNDTAGPRLFTGFLKVSPDMGYSHALQGGVSAGRSRSHHEAFEIDEGVLGEGLAGTAWFAATDWVWRYDSARPLGQGDATVQAEYLYRKKDLALVARDGVAVTGGAPHVFAQDGLYVQGVYGIASRWTLGGRLDIIGLTNRQESAFGTTDVGRSTRYSAALTFNPTEFSRLRVQYNAGRVRSGGQVRFNQVFVQFQMSLGTHGAHRF